MVDLANPFSEWLVTIDETTHPIRVPIVVGSDTKLLEYQTFFPASRVSEKCPSQNDVVRFDFPLVFLTEGRWTDKLYSLIQIMQETNMLIYYKLLSRQRGSPNSTCKRITCVTYAPSLQYNYFVIVSSSKLITRIDK